MDHLKVTQFKRSQSLADTALSGCTLVDYILSQNFILGLLLTTNGRPVFLDLFLNRLHQPFPWLFL